MSEAFTGESWIESSYHVNSKRIKMNQDFTEDTGVTNPIQRKCPEKTFPGETKLLKTTGVRPFLGSPLLFFS